MMYVFSRGKSRDRRKTHYRSITDQLVECVGMRTIPSSATPQVDRRVGKSADVRNRKNELFAEFVLSHASVERSIVRGLRQEDSALERLMEARNEMETQRSLGPVRWAGHFGTLNAIHETHYKHMVITDK